MVPFEWAKHHNYKASWNIGDRERLILCNKQMPYTVATQGQWLDVCVLQGPCTQPQGASISYKVEQEEEEKGQGNVRP